MSIGSQNGLPTAAELEQVLLDALTLESDSTVVDRPDWLQVSTPSSKRSGHNQILRARLGSDEIEDRIRSVAAEYGARGAKYRWVVAASSAPEGLAQAIEDSGLMRLGSAAAMAMVVPDEIPEMPIDLRIERITPEQVPRYAAVTARAWERGGDFEESAAYFARHALASGYGLECFMMFLGDEPVASSTLRFLPDKGYFQGCAVLPAYRKRGIYRASLLHRLGLLRARGLEVAVVWADERTSAPVCDRVGFRRLSRGTWLESPDD
jgi:GNAT superfamily N-acetyltransferase